MRSFGKKQKNRTRAFSSRLSAVLQSSLYLIFAAPLIASCTIASNQTGPSRPVSIAEDVESVRRIAYPSDWPSFYAMSPANQANGRNQIITARMYIADLEYHYYESRLTREMQDEGLVATAVSLGLTGSASLIPVAQTSRLLSGIATGVTGLDKAYNEKELLSNTVQALQTQMRADRKAWAAEIQAKMVKADKTTATPIVEYTLAMALSDADSYYQAGTITSALIGLSKTLANAESNAAQAKADSGPNAPAVSRAKATANQVAKKPAAPAPRGAAGAPIAARESLRQTDRGTSVQSPVSLADYKQIIVDYDPKVHTISKVEPALVKLCVPEAELRAIGERTKVLIRVFQLAAGLPITGQLRTVDLVRLNNVGDCPADRLNYYEANLMTNGLNSPSVISAFNNKLTSDKKLSDNASVFEVRSRISELRATLASKLKLQSPLLVDQVTSDLMGELSRP